MTPDPLKLNDMLKEIGHLPRNTVRKMGKFGSLTPLFVLIFNFCVPLNAPASDTLDFSTPDKTLALFVKAFKIGDDNLLDEVLAPNASLPEFNPIQKIDCPSPEIEGFDVTKFRVVLNRGQYISESKPGDIEAYVILKVNEKLREKNSKCIISLWEKGAYLLRSINNKWKIVDVVPFWPEEIEKESEKLSK